MAPKRVKRPAAKPKRRAVAARHGTRAHGMAHGLWSESREAFDGRGVVSSLGAQLALGASLGVV